MNDQKIYELIARTPQIRAVQIADALDQELSDVSEALRALVAEGDVVRTSATAPNGQPAQIYTLSDQFKKTNEYKSIMAKMVSASPQPAAPSPTLPAAAVDPVPVFAVMAELVPVGMTRIASAVEFVANNYGRVTGVQMMKHMGLRTGQAPVSYLSGAIKDGRLARDGSDWILGDALAPTANKPPVAPAVPVIAVTPSVGDVNSTEKGSGARFNHGKPDYSLIPFSTLTGEAQVWAYGKQKYAAWNWTKGMAWSIPFACMMRHMAAWQAGEECDPESGLPHLAHAMCNLRMLTLYATNFTAGDDRPKQELLA